MPKEKKGSYIQQYSCPPLQELFISDPPGLGRAATKAAKIATAKRVSLESMVKMSEMLCWGINY